MEKTEFHDTTAGLYAVSQHLKQPWPELRDFLITQDFPVAKTVRDLFDDKADPVSVLIWLYFYVPVDQSDAGQKQHIIASLVHPAVLSKALGPIETGNRGEYIARLSYAALKNAEQLVEASSLISELLTRIKSLEERL
jgi:hypothetical protein